MDLRWVVLVLSHYLLLFLTAEANHYLSPLHLSLFPGGLFVAYSAMRFSPRAGFISTAGAGLLLEAGVPGAYGVRVFGLLFLHALILQWRRRIGLGELWQLVLVAVVCTPLLHTAVFLAGLFEQPVPSAYLARWAVDAILSTGVTALVAPWWFSLQSTGLEMLGFSRRDEEAETA